MQSVLAAAGHEVEVHGLTPPRRVSRALSLLAAGGYPYDLTIHTERAAPGWMALSRRNVLLPNPEWFESTPAVAKMDAILCKTRWTAEIMEPLHPRTVFVGFSSLDRSVPGIAGAMDAPLHIAGRSPSKGTEALLAVWSRRPEWPVLRVVAWKEALAIPGEMPPNIQVKRDFVEDGDLQRVQAGSGFHLCPSAAEGFGHTLVEGMSTRAVVLTTDAPPMNELVGPDRGVLVAWTRSEPMRAGRRFDVDPDALESAIGRVLATPPAQLERSRAAARAWFETNDAAFRRRLVGVVDELLS